MSQRLKLYLRRYCSPRNVIYAVSGLREWDLIRVGLITRGYSPPNPLKRLSGESAELVHAPPYIRVGRENLFADAIWLYELPSGSRNHILELREKEQCCERGRSYEQHSTIRKASP